MKIRPSQTFCGCFTLSVGVEVISAITILLGIGVIAICDSQESLRVSGVTVYPHVQVMLATWGFLGIVTAVNAGVGAVYRIEAAIKIFFFYQAISFTCGFLLPLMFLVSGDLCDTVVDHEVQRMGSAFICGFADTVFFAWLLIVGIIHAYVVYIIWSAGEDIARNPYPELSRYQSSLKGIDHLEPEGRFPFNNSRAMPGVEVPTADKMAMVNDNDENAGEPLRRGRQGPYAPGGGNMYGATSNMREAISPKSFVA